MFSGGSVRYQLQQVTFMVSLLNFLVPNQGVAYTIFTGGKVVGIATKIVIQRRRRRKKKGKTPRWKILNLHNIMVTRFFK